MDEIIREALNFVTQSKPVKEEVPDPKAKGGKKDAKPDAGALLFEGKDTTRYKDIAETVA
jgi:hypothetical protein